MSGSHRIRGTQIFVTDRAAWIIYGYSLDGVNALAGRRHVDLIYKGAICNQGGPSCITAVSVSQLWRHIGNTRLNNGCLHVKLVFT